MTTEPRGNADRRPLDPAQDPELQPSALDVPVVGIGASAGGKQSPTLCAWRARR